MRTKEREKSKEGVKKNRDNKRDSGLKKVDPLYLDSRTMNELVRMAKKFGYEIKRNEKAFAYQAVITLALENLGKSVKTKQDRKVRVHQQRVLLAREISYLKKPGGMSSSEIAEYLNGKRINKRVEATESWTSERVKSFYDKFGKKNVKLELT